MHSLPPTDENRLSSGSPTEFVKSKTGFFVCVNLFLDEHLIVVSLEGVVKSGNKEL